MLKNTATKYGAVSKSFHWLMSMIIISLIIVGFIMTSMDKSALKFSLYDTHKLTGLFLLLLVLPRLIWRLANITPSLAFLPKWERVLDRLGQYMLYLLMLAMPISGWCMSTAAGYIPSIGGFEIAAPISQSESLASIFKEIHFISAWILVAILVLHLVGALKAHLIDKNYILKRMLP